MQTLVSLFNHLDTVEPWLCYETIWIDQATENRQRFSDRFRFHTRLFFSKRVGLPTAFTYAFSLCTTPYIMLMEDDWLINNTHFPVISHSLELIKKLPHQVYGVMLRKVEMQGRTLRRYDGTTKYANSSAWAFLDRATAFNNPVTIHRMSNIQEMLKVEGYRSEGLFSRVARKMKYHYVSLDWPRKGEENASPRMIRDYFFDHIGKKYANRNNMCNGESFS